MHQQRQQNSAKSYKSAGMRRSRQDGVDMTTPAPAADGGDAPAAGDAPAGAPADDAGAGGLDSGAILGLVQGLSAVRGRICERKCRMA